MKEQIEPPLKDKIKIVAQKEVDKKQELLGQIRVIKGCTMYQMSLTTGQISKVQFDSAVLNISKGTSQKKMIRQPGFIYLQAFNDKNAKRKFQNRVKQIIAANKPKNENPIRRTV